MKTVVRYTFLLFVIIGGVYSYGVASDVSDMPPQVQARQYMRQIAEANISGDNARILDLCEKMLALRDVDIDPSIRFYYATSLLAVGRKNDAEREMKAFLKTPDIDPDLIDQALDMLEKMPDREKGINYYLRKNYKEAIHNLLPFGENDPEIQAMLAESYKAENNSAESKKWTEKAAGHDFRKIIEKYEKQADVTNSGLKYVVIRAGQGTRPNPEQKVEIHYTGRLMDGKAFDTSEGRGVFSFYIGKGHVIKGMDEAVSNMQIGEKRAIIIPPDLAYGSKSIGGGLIPANSTLFFEIERIK